MERLLYWVYDYPTWIVGPFFVAGFIAINRKKT